MRILKMELRECALCGITETLVTSLSKIADLRVTPWATSRRVAASRLTLFGVAWQSWRGGMTDPFTRQAVG